MLHDVKPPIYLPESYFWLYIVAIVIFAIIGLCIVWFSRSQKKVSVEPSKNPQEVALNGIDKLISLKLIEAGRPHEFFSRLSEIVRRYFEDAFSIRAVEMTTEEFLLSLKDSDQLADEHKAGVKKLLNVCDMVKFAKHVPGANEAQEAVGLAREIIH